MFCTKCGYKNTKDSLFCQECGARLPIKSNKNIIDALKEAPKSLYIIAGAIFVLMIIGAIGGRIIKKQTSPIAMINKYMEAYSEEKWDVVYSYLDITENQWVNKESFIKQKELDTEPLDKIVNYDIINKKTEETDFNAESGNRDDTGLIQVYEVAYVTQNSSMTQTMEIRLNTQKKKRFMFFNTYLVHPSAYMATDCTIYAPQDSKVFIDGIELTPSGDKTSTQDGDLAAYTVDYLFKGNYDITIEHPLGQQLTMEEVSFSNDEEVMVDHLLFNGTMREERFQDTQGYLQQLMKGAINGEEFMNLNLPVLNTVNAKDSCEEAYNKLREQLEINEHGVGYKSITIKGFTDTSTQDKFDSHQTYTSKIEFEFDYVRMVKTGWGSSRTKEERSEKTQKGTFTINYIFKDMEWQIESYHIDGLNE
ncbi:MAG TPA: zinc-ribbon domain-containing protein [Candidatus Merdenecus merdavium]|nr:zinc-ribbon domain-containing protein [Candidatus Merdenecus merdavium]